MFDMNNRTFLILCLVSLTGAEIFSIEKIKSYARIFKLDKLSANETGNELWHGLFKDCDKRVTFSCIQKNAYSYLDSALAERSNISVFDGLVLRKNDLIYESCPKRQEESLNENLVDAETRSGNNCEDEDEDSEVESGRKLEDEPESPLEEVTNALRRRTVKFLATRDYEIQLPSFISEGASIRISPKEVDENGALVRIDFGQRALDNPQARIFKKLRKFIQGRLITALLGLLLIIKLVKVKFMFVIPFLFGIGTAKKLFLKLLLFFIPAFAHIFKLCSSFYSSHSTKYHHHHHQIAHHHHHVPVPVPVPTYYNHNHHHHHEDDFEGYDYAHPHIQYRKDVEELKEWGIEPYEEPYDDINRLRPVPGVLPAPISPVQGQAPVQGQMYPSSYGLPQYAANVRPVAAYQEKQSVAAHSMAYNGYLDESSKFRRVAVQPTVSPVMIEPGNILVSAALQKNGMAGQKNFVGQSVRVHGLQRMQGVQSGQRQTKSAGQEQGPRKMQEEDYYAAIVGRLEAIFAQLRFFDETCRERLVCSMYKSPTQYSPHSNLVSNELARDPHELKRGMETTASQRFHRYVTAARLGQDGGDCTRIYPCRINTE